MSIFGRNCLDSIKANETGYPTPLLHLQTTVMAEASLPETDIAGAIDEVLAEEVDPNKDPLELVSNREYEAVTPGPGPLSAVQVIS